MQQQVPASVPAEFENGVPADRETPFPPPLAPEAFPPQEAFLAEPKKNNWATFNLILSLFGYQFLGGLFSPVSIIWGLSIEDSWVVTYPVRAIQILVATYVLFFVALRNRSGAPKWTFCYKLIIFLFALNTLRLFYDTQFPRHMMEFYESTAWNAGQENFKLWSLQLIDGLGLFSVIFSIHLVDFRKAVRWIFWGGLIGLFFSLWSVDQAIAEESYLTNQNYSGSRATAGVALRTQALGYYGVTIAMVSVYYLLERAARFKFSKIVAIAGILLGLYIAIKAGSRGPFLAVIVVTLFYLMARTRYAIIAVPVGLIVSVTAWLLRFQVVEILGYFNPSIKTRLLMTLEEGHTAGRTDLWAEYWQVACDNPIFGCHHTALGYAHNSFIDGFFMYGFFLGWLPSIVIILAFVYSYKILKMHDPRWWIVLFVLVGAAVCVTQSSCLGSGASVIAALYVLQTQKPKTPAFPQNQPIQ